MIHIEDKLLKTQETAELLGLSQKTLRFYSSTGGGPLPVVRLGRAVRYRLSDINNLMAGNASPVQEKRGPGRPRKTKK
jgi:predicted DNA-binding transcriptional regulator AlpA